MKKKGRGQPAKAPTKVASFRVLKRNHGKFVKEVRPIAKKHS